MKVRHKTQRSDIDLCYEVIDESIIHWIVLNSVGHGYRLALPKSEYEPVPEEQWVDVTAECEAIPGSLYFAECLSITHKGEAVDHKIYRLRKKNAFKDICVPIEYFIVEKKQ